MCQTSNINHHWLLVDFMWSNEKNHIKSTNNQWCWNLICILFRTRATDQHCSCFDISKMKVRMSPIFDFQLFRCPHSCFGEGVCLVQQFSFSWHLPNLWHERRNLLRVFMVKCLWLSVPSEQHEHHRPQGALSTEKILAPAGIRAQSSQEVKATNVKFEFFKTFDFSQMGSIHLWHKG